MKRGFLNCFFRETRRIAGKLPSSAEEGMWRAAPQGWCDCCDPAAGAAPPIRSNHPAAVCGRGFPSLSKEGNFSAEFRDRNQTPALHKGAHLRCGTPGRLSDRLTIVQRKGTVSDP
jgi:hypothetical protein